MVGRTAWLVVQFEGVLPKVAPYVAHALVDLDGQASIVLDVSPEVYELVRLVVHLAGGLYAERNSVTVETSYETFGTPLSAPCLCRSKGVDEKCR